MPYHKTGNLLMKLAQANGFNSRLCFMAKEKIQQQNVAIQNLNTELSSRPDMSSVWWAVSKIADTATADAVVGKLTEKIPYEVPEKI